MKAAFFTDGYTTTQTDLLSRSFGMPSGMPRISFNTTADSFNRSTSFFSFSALSSPSRGMTNSTARAVTNSFLFISPPIYEVEVRCHIGVARVEPHALESFRETIGHLIRVPNEGQL